MGQACAKDISDANHMISLPDSHRILTLGAGGGSDCVHGLPLYLRLRDAGKEVHLANLTFVQVPGRPGILDVEPSTPLYTPWFPELFLARWLAKEGIPAPVHCVPRTGVRPLAAMLLELCQRLGVDTVVVVDAGMDALLKGDEAKVGSIHEDLATIGAVHMLEGVRKILLCTGLGLDPISTEQVLQRIAELADAGALLETSELQPEDPVNRRYLSALEFICKSGGPIRSGHLEAMSYVLRGVAGSRMVGPEGKQRSVNLSASMLRWWIFDLDLVAQSCPIIPHIARTQTYNEVWDAVDEYRRRIPI